MTKCSICEKEEGRGKKNICRKCWRKEHTKKNRKKLRKQAQMRYLSNRERNLKNSKDWAKENKDKVVAHFRKWRKENPELSRLRARTRNEFRELKKRSKCKKCGTKEKLEFHHLEPYQYNKFEIFCRECHMEIHGTLLVRKNKNQGVLERQGEQDGMDTN